MSDNGDCGAIIEESYGGDILGELEWHHVEEDLVLRMVTAEDLDQVDVLVLGAMEPSGVWILTFSAIGELTTGFNTGITVVLVMPPAGTDGTTLDCLQLVQFLVLVEASPGSAVSESGAGKLSLDSGEGVSSFALRTCSEGGLLLLDLGLDLSWCPSGTFGLGLVTLSLWTSFETSFWITQVIDFSASGIAILNCSTSSFMDLLALLALLGWRWRLLELVLVIGDDVYLLLT